MLWNLLVVAALANPTPHAAPHASAPHASAPHASAPHASAPHAYEPAPSRPGPVYRPTTHTYPWWLYAHAAEDNSASPNVPPDAVPETEDGWGWWAVLATVGVLAVACVGLVVVSA